MRCVATRTIAHGPPDRPPRPCLIERSDVRRLKHQHAFPQWALIRIVAGGAGVGIKLVDPETGPAETPASHRAPDEEYGRQNRPRLPAGPGGPCGAQQYRLAWRAGNARGG